jgi:hypothetical protein
LRLGVPTVRKITPEPITACLVISELDIPLTDGFPRELGDPHSVERDLACFRRGKRLAVELYPYRLKPREEEQTALEIPTYASPTTETAVDSFTFSIDSESLVRHSECLPVGLRIPHVEPEFPLFDGNSVHS